MIEDTRNESATRKIRFRGALVRMLRRRYRRAHIEQQREQLKRDHRVLATPVVRHLTNEIKVLMAKMAELDDSRPRLRAEDAAAGEGWRERDLDLHIRALKNSIEHIGTAVVRATGAKVEARERLYAARVRCRTAPPVRIRVHRNTRARRTVRVVAASKPSSTADPDGSSGNRPRALRSSAGGVA